MEELPAGYGALLETLSRDERGREEIRPPVETGLPEIVFQPLRPEDSLAAMLRAAKRSLENEREVLREEAKQHRTALARKAWRMRRLARKGAAHQARKYLSEKVLRVESCYDSIVASAAEDCLDAVRKVSRWVIRRELGTAPATLRIIIEHALRALRLKRIRHIRVHPSVSGVFSEFPVPVETNDALDPDEAAIVTLVGEVQVSVQNDLKKIIDDIRSQLHLDGGQAYRAD